MLTRKYYRLIARVIKDNSDIVKDISVDTDGINSTIINKDSFINDLSIEFKKDNSLFNSDRFVDACND